MTLAYAPTSLIYAASDGRHRPASHPVLGGRRAARSTTPLPEWDGERLRERRIALGWTQGRLATVLGVTRPAVSWWESGGHPPNAENRARIERLLGRLA